jgi:hypothetical protein
LETPRAPDTPDPDERAINADESAIAADVGVREAEGFEPGEEFGSDPAPGRQAGRIARSTAFFSPRRPRP